MRAWTVTAATALMVWTAAIPAAAQGTPARPAPAVEGAVGWAGFTDEDVVHHAIVGAGVRVYISRRVSLGPEVQYLAGPGSDRDLILTGNLIVDLLAPSAAAPRRTTPYVVVGGGLFRHSDRFASGRFWSTEGAVTAGLGIRTWLTERVFATADARIGWEPHLRLAAGLGVSFPR